MKRLGVRTILAGALWLLLICAAAAGPVGDKLTADELARAKAGEVIVKTNLEGGAKVGYATAIGVMRFDDPNDFWTVLIDYDGFPEFLPDITKAVVIKKEGNLTWLELTMDGGIKPVVYTNKYTGYPEKGRSEWTLDLSRPHVPYTKNDGHWQIEKIGEGEYLVEHHMDIAVDFGALNVIGTRVMAAKLKNNLPALIDNVRRRVASGGTWKIGD